MVSDRSNEVGRFAVEIELVNNDDLVRAKAGVISPQDIRRTRLRGVVNTGATRLVIPEGTARQLGLESIGRTGVRYADGRFDQRELVGGAQLSYSGRSDTFSAIVEPGRDSALIGAIVLEALDLVVDCNRQILAPRDPNQIISEEE